MSLGTVALELALAVGLWFRRGPPLAGPAGVALHVLIYMTLPVTVFSALSCLLPGLLDPDEVHRRSIASGPPTSRRSRGLSSARADDRPLREQRE